MTEPPERLHHLTVRERLRGGQINRAGDLCVIANEIQGTTQIVFMDPSFAPVPKSGGSGFVSSK